MTKLILLMIFFFFSFQKSESSSDKICYKTSYYFINVAETCIEYIYNGDNLETHIRSETIGLVKIFKDIVYEGFAVADLKTLKPKVFYFLQKEGDVVIEHMYKFHGNFVDFNKTFKENDREIKKVSKKIEIDNPLDPFTAHLKLLREVEFLDKGELNVFFNGKVYSLPFRTLSLEPVFMIEVKPRYDIEGYLKPTGRWILWINPDSKKIEKMLIKIKIGKVKLYRENKN
ncbi:DUF3108 domain-containing protein [Persephonella sp.]